MSIRKKRNPVLALIGLAIILVLGPLVYFGLTKPHKTVAAWFDDRFAYRTAITITNSGSAVTNQKVKLDIDTSTLYTAGKIQINCNDSRFTDINGKLLQYYLDSTNGACNTSSTDYWVLIPTINAGSTTIYHYYGNPSATKGSQSSQLSQATFSQSATTTATEEQAKSPVAYWAFDEGQGTVVNDSSSNRNNGTLGASTAAPTWKTEDMCISGKCLYFDGSNDYVGAGDPANGNLDFGTNNFSVCSWVKNSQTLADTSNSYIIASKKSNYNGTNAGWAFTLHGGASGGIEFRINDGSTTNDVTSLPTARTYNNLLSDSGWHYLCAVAVRSSNATLYIDGKSVGGGSISTMSNSISNSNSFTIGKYQNYSSMLFQGFLDEVKIYPYARSAAEIKADFNARSVPKGLSLRTQGLPLQKPNGAFMSEGLVGYWKMDENTGTTTADSSGNGNTGTFGTGSSAPSWSAGMYGVGLSFDGSDYVAKTSGFTQLSDEVTYAAWIKTNGSSTYGLISLTQGAGNLYLWLQPTSRTVTFRTSTSTNTYDLTTTNALTIGTWYHLTATRDSSGNKKIYINGTLSASDNTPSSWVTPSTTNFTFGAQAPWAGYFNGTMDEVRVYNRALSPAEVRNLYNWAPGPVAYYNFNEGVGSSAYDSSGYGNNGVWSGTGTHWGTGKYGKAGKFNGTDDYIGVSDNALLRGMSKLTVESWVKFNSASVKQQIVYKWGSPNNAYILQRYNDNYYYFEVSGNGTEDIYFKSTNTYTDTGVWHHIAGVYDGSSSIKIYLDGIQLSGSIVGTVPATIYNGSGSSVSIGKGSAYTDGSIDEVKIYNYARTPAQILSDMAAGKQNQMLGYWKFDEGYGTVARDSSTIARNDGALGSGTSAPTWSNDGKFGKALSFDGNDWVSFPDMGY